MQGHLPAIYDLGANFYYNGVGIEKKLKNKVQLFCEMRLLIKEEK